MKGTTMTTMTWAQIEDRLDDEPTEATRAEELLSFAASVLALDVQQNATWVVQRAVTRAIRAVVDVVDDAQDVNVTAAIEAAVILGLGLGGVREALSCHPPAAIDSDHSSTAYDFALSGIERAAATLEQIVRESWRSSKA
jgi:hypothetical protein